MSFSFTRDLESSPAHYKKAVIFFLLHALCVRKILLPQGSTENSYGQEFTAI